MKEIDVVIRTCEHFVQGGADEFATTNEGDFLIIEIDAIASKEPINGSSGGGVITAMAR